MLTHKSDGHEQHVEDGQVVRYLRADQLMAGIAREKGLPGIDVLKQEALAGPLKVLRADD